VAIPYSDVSIKTKVMTIPYSDVSIRT